MFSKILHGIYLSVTVIGSITILAPYTLDLLKRIFFDTNSQNNRNNTIHYYFDILFNFEPYIGIDANIRYYPERDIFGSRNYSPFARSVYYQSFQQAAGQYNAYDSDSDQEINHADFEDDDDANHNADDLICGFTPAFIKTVDDTPVLCNKKGLGSLEELLTCPYSKKPLVDPVILSDGYSYNRSCVEKILEQGFSPVTKQWLNPGAQYINRRLKAFCDWVYSFNKKSPYKRADKPDSTCGLTLDELEVPVVLSSGHTVDKRSAKEWSQNNINQLLKCPFTRDDLDLTLQVEDKTLKHVIRAYKSLNNNYSASPK